MILICTVALLHDFVILSYNRFFATEYRDVVKEAALLGVLPGEQLTWLQRLAVWDATSIPQRVHSFRK